MFIRTESGIDSRRPTPKAFRLSACVVVLFFAARLAPGQEAGGLQPADTIRFEPLVTVSDTTAPFQQPVQDTSAVSLRTGAEQLSGASASVQANPAAADGVQSVDDDGVRPLEIDGLVVDETQSKLGRDFYDAFYGRWRAPDGAFNFTVVVKEQPMPNLGTRIIVQVNEEVAFQAQLQPRFEVIESMAHQAVAYTAYMLQNRTPLQYGY